MSLTAEWIMVLLLVGQSAGQYQFDESSENYPEQHPQPDSELPAGEDCFNFLFRDLKDSSFQGTGKIETTTEPSQHALERKNVTVGYEFSYEIDDDNGSTPVIVEGIWTAVTWYVWRDPNGNEYRIECTTDAEGSKVHLRFVEYTDDRTTLPYGPPRGPPRLAISTGALKSLVEANYYRMPSPGKRIQFKKIMKKRQT